MPTPSGWGRPSLGRSWPKVAVALQVSLGLSAAAALFVSISNRPILDVYRRLADDPAGVTLAEAEGIDRLSLLQVVELPLYLVCGVLFITWLYQAHHSDRMQGDFLEHKSGWAIGGWFVPILNFWRPFQMVSDVRRGATGVRLLTSWPLQVAWWTSFVVMTILDRIVSRLYIVAARTPDSELDTYVAQLETAIQWELASCVVTVVSAILAVLLVRKLTATVLTSGESAPA